ITGAPSEVKTFAAQMGLYNNLTKEWTPYQVASVGSQLSTPLLSVEQRINESRSLSIQPGEDLRVRLHYKNTLDVALKNVSLEVELRARSASNIVNAEEVLDFRSLQVSRGVYNGTTKRIVWSPASVAEFASLAPHGEGDLSFMIRLNPMLGVDLDFTDLVIESAAQIRANEVPGGFEGVDLSSKDLVETKVVARTVLSSLGLYRNQYLASAGPLPPKVGQKTAYTVFWQISNSLNDVRDVEVRAKLSPAAAWEKRYVPEGSAISYDETSGTIIWRVGMVAAGSGRAKPAPYIAYQISITPGLDQVGKSPILVSDIEVRGRDTFTNEEVLLKAPNITAELKGDPTTTERDWSVIR
ncbi:MAG: hypothetical protein HY372_02605, partial [Candidatus Andersenbacteria bacterium]|nr:hypothetical protein [Candidatus Andersenbacteria bacterium]